MRTLISIVSTALLAASSPALAQSETDLPDDIFGDTTTPEPSVAQEREQLLAESDQPALALPEADKRKRIIQTLQRKTFMKIDRFEGGVMGGFVTNDPFINRYLVNGSLAYHVTEIFAVEANGSFSPDFGTGDYKPITQQIITENEVTPDISKIQFYASGNFQFSPIYGKVAVGEGSIINFDIYGVFGAGVVNTRDDLVALGKEDEDQAIVTAAQFHPTLNFGGGARVIFSESFAARVEGRGLSYIEVLESTTLEMKNNFTLLAGVSFFFPGMN
jgi:outer membrane beta-barrel protein